MKRLNLTCTVAAVLCGAVLMCAGGAGAQSKETTIRFSTFFPPSHQNAKITEEWGKEVEKRTRGKVKVRHYAGGTLTSAAQTYDSVAGGVIDAGNIVLGYTMGKFPLSEVLDYPLGIPSGSVATRMMNAYYEKFKPKELDEVKIMYLHSVGPGNLHTRAKPVAKLDDLKGLKIRTYGPNAKLMTLLGATPVAMPQGDAYDAIAKGVVDGGLWAYEALQGWKWGEIVRYTTQSYGSAYTTAMFIVMNKAKWNALPPDVQKVFEDVSKEYTDKQAALWDKIDKDGAEFAKSKGVKTITLSAAENARWAAKVKPLLDEYVTNMKAKGLPGDEAVKFCLDFLKKN